MEVCERRKFPISIYPKLQYAVSLDIPQQTTV